MATPEELEIFRRHLAQRAFICPICQNATWELVEITTVPLHPSAGLALPKFRDAIVHSRKQKNDRDLTIPASTTPPKRAFPVAVVACDRCAFVAQFSWLAILDKGA
jgi:hypothetical protein